MSNERWTSDATGDQSGQAAMVTEASTGIGLVTAPGVRSTHAWYRNHAIEIHSGSSRPRCWARVVLILYETPHTWSALEGWPPDEQWGHTAADAVAAATDRAKAWIDGWVDRTEDALWSRP